MERERALLDELVEKSGLSYVSDMRYATERKDVYLVGRIWSAIEEIQTEQYSLNEWNQAVRYLINEAEQETSQKAKDRICKALATICGRG